MRTPHQILADTFLGEPVEDWIRRLRPMSYRAIATKLAEETGGKVQVSHQAIYQWVGKDESNGDEAA